MAKTFVTHYYPDLDGICGIWLFKRFGGRHYEDGTVAFVSASKTLNNQEVDSDPNVIHIDTGHGMFDHHSTKDANVCAAKKVLHHLEIQDEVLDRIVEHVTAIDHFRDLTWNNPLDDIYDFQLHCIITSWKAVYPEKHTEYVDWGMICLDGVYQSLKSKISAQKSIEEDSVRFESWWGPGMAIQTFNDEVIRVGQKMGFALTIRKDPYKHYVRIKGRSDRDDIDLTDTYDRLVALDPEATWFLHPDKKQLLNGNTKNPDNVSTKLTLEEIVEIVTVR